MMRPPEPCHDQDHAIALPRDPARPRPASASNCIEFGTSRPSALAVLRLITSSNLSAAGPGPSRGLVEKAPERFRNPSCACPTARYRRKTVADDEAIDF